MKNIIGVFFRNTPATIMRCGRTFRLARTHPTHARLSGSETLSRSRSLVGYTIDTHESEFSEATGSITRSFLRSGQVEPWSRLRPLDRGASAKPPDGCCGLRCERPWLECLAGLLSLPALRPCCFRLNTP